MIALEGDGSLLMQLGCLATVAARAPKNLTIVVWDNGIYQITGGQMTASAATADLVAIAQASGIAKSAWAADEDEFDRLFAEALKGGTRLTVANCRDEESDRTQLSRHRGGWADLFDERLRRVEQPGAAARKLGHATRRWTAVAHRHLVVVGSEQPGHHADRRR